MLGIMYQFEVITRVLISLCLLLFMEYKELGIGYKVGGPLCSHSSSLDIYI